MVLTQQGMLTAGRRGITPEMNREGSAGPPGEKVSRLTRASSQAKTKQVGLQSATVLALAVSFQLLLGVTLPSMEF